LGMCLLLESMARWHAVNSAAC